MADLDLKEIGMGAKDVLVGALKVYAGSTGGPAGAQGVDTAASGLERVIGGVTGGKPPEQKPDATKGTPPSDKPPPTGGTLPTQTPDAAKGTAPGDKPPNGGTLPAQTSDVDVTGGLPPDAGSRAKRMDRQGFEARRVVRQVEEAPTRTTDVAPQKGAPADSDAAFVERYLRFLGWPRHKIVKILAGPESAHVEEIAAREVPGMRAGDYVNGQRVAQADAERVEQVGAERVPMVDGEKVKANPLTLIQLFFDLKQDDRPAWLAQVAESEKEFDSASWAAMELSASEKQMLDLLKGRQRIVGTATPYWVNREYQKLSVSDRQKALRMIDEIDGMSATSVWARINLDGARRITEDK